MLTDYRSLYDKDFIGAWDLQAGDLTVTIKKCIGGSLVAPGGRKSKKPVVYMAHTEKGFALNATNGKTIAALYGNYVEKWAGKRITLYKSMTRSPQGDGEVECIRVRPSVPDNNTTDAERDIEESAAPQSPASGGTTEQRAAGTADAEAYITPDQVIQLETALQDAGIPIDKFKKRAKLERLALMTADRFEPALKWIAEQRTQ